MSRLRGVLFLAGGLLVGLVAGGILLFGLPGRTAASRRPPPPSTGMAVADFELEGLNRKTNSLSDLRGKPVVLNFWATWCPPCREEMPLFERYAKLLKDEVQFIGVNYAEDAVTVQNYITANRISFPIWLDERGSVADLYYIDSYPNTFFIDAEGVLKAQHIGQLSEDLLLKYLAAVGVKP